MTALNDIDLKDMMNTISCMVRDEEYEDPLKFIFLIQGNKTLYKKLEVRKWLKRIIREIENACGKEAVQEHLDALQLQQWAEECNKDLTFTA
jgi:hypothetical protein